MGDPFIRLLETIADNKFVLGDRLVEIGFSGPALEASLASIAMAQGELGHARTLYSWASKLKGEKGDPSVAKQTGNALSSLTRVDDWISLIAAHYVATTAHDILIQSMMEARPDETASRIHKLCEEQKEHLSYAKEWIRQLSAEKGVIPRRLQENLLVVHREAYAWMQSIETETDLVSEGFLLSNERLTGQFQMALEDEAWMEAITHA